MSFVPSIKYANFDSNVIPHSFFSLFVKPVDEPIIPSIKNNNGNELKAFWQPEASDNNKILLNSSIKTNSDYRKYMTNKATIIRDYNTRHASL